MKSSFLVRCTFDEIGSYEQVLGELEGVENFLGSLQFEGQPKNKTLHLADEGSDFVVDGEFTSDFYFSTPESADSFRLRLMGKWKKKSQIQEIAGEDWNKKWRDSFAGAEVPPFWKIVPEWIDNEENIQNKKIIRMNPSLGFGTGEHTTTQLCLSAIASLSFQPTWEVMDFGSGSGILSVASIMMGAKSVDAIEIDGMALESSKGIFKINNISEKQIQLSNKMPEEKTFNLIVANILFSILQEKAEELIHTMKPTAILILSGFFEPDAEVLSKVYLEKLSNYSRKILVKDSWACIVMSPNNYL
ncbi:MAG: hypothetical protein COV44_08050 [Deltaproteobacteria bacterium CG11_big_fil_rev_8_21_14_0_20_45_16]|nr:MAG: hypothetical protein COV44_08050 [Deltaproteobacteria bacterium CG11_big_fil_rev_8_21_14_0_20_45_16]